MAVPSRENNRNIGPLSRVTAVSSVFVIFLALGALLWPQELKAPHQSVFLVLDGSASSQRIQYLYEPLRSYLEKIDGQDISLDVLTSAHEFQARVQLGPRYVLCPDGVAMNLPVERFAPLVTGRRAAPQNLRPRGVLVFGKHLTGAAKQWKDNYSRVIVGDSLSLLVKENLVGDIASLGAVGPDPYDHSPVLHTLRLTDFDFALVRQWDALRFFESGLLSHEDWAMELLGVAWPDLVLFANRDIRASRRVKTAENLAAVGRDSGNEQNSEKLLLDGLRLVNLTGFNMFLEPDFDLVRKRSSENWPLKGN